MKFLKLRKSLKRKNLKTFKKKMMKRNYLIQQKAS